MCGRFNLVVNKSCNALLEDLSVDGELHTRYNIAPTEEVQVILQEAEHNRLRHMRWWLIPKWVKEPGTRYSMFNARAETLDQSPAFRAPFRHQRCIIPATSYLEWKTERGHKQPYEIWSPNRVMAMAGLWEHWSDGQSDIFSCTVITREADPSISQIHPRQPVLLPGDALQRWLDPDIDGRELVSLLQPGLDQRLEVQAVDKMISNSRLKIPSNPL